MAGMTNRGIFVAAAILLLACADDASTHPPPRMAAPDPAPRYAAPTATVSPEFEQAMAKARAREAQVRAQQAAADEELRTAVAAAQRRQADDRARRDKDLAEAEERRQQYEASPERVAERARLARQAADPDLYELCRLTAEKQDTLARMSRERNNPSGYVNKTELHRLGSQLQDEDEAIAALRRKRQDEKRKPFAVKLCDGFYP
jgi:hypothetical protein